jgi:hypothetical protein
VKEEMRSGDVQTFKSFDEFERQEGKITAHSVMGKKVMFWTKDGTYTVSKKVWDKMKSA